MSTEENTLSIPVLITRNEELRRLCEQWCKQSLLALDTEFIRTDTFFPRLGLIQVCDDKGSYLLDPLTLTDWTAFKAILADSTIMKVLHSCSEDLVVFKGFFGQLPAPLFDTQKAAAFLNFGYSISYQNMVKELLNIEISKGQTRSDWLRRPLSDEQISYAALDVAFLPKIYRNFKQQLIETQRLSWLQYECNEMLNLAFAEDSEPTWDNCYQNIGSAWRLNSRQLEVLQRLCVWREEEARRRDKPRSWIAKDSDLLLLAEREPQDKISLSSLAEVSKPLVNKDADTLLTLIRAPHHGAPLKLPAVDYPLTGAMRADLKKCQSVISQKADELGIAPEMLARKKQLLPIVIEFSLSREFSWPESLSGWRQPLLENPIRQALC